MVRTIPVRHDSIALDWVSWRLLSNPPTGVRKGSDRASFCDCQRDHAGRWGHAHATLERLRREVEGVVSAVVSRREVQARVKDVFSTWLKMRAKGLRFDEIDDFLGARVIVENINDCYAVLEAVRRRWRTVGGTKDYIRRPKENGYRSLHVTLIDDITGAPFELQIRTRAMHELSQNGAASHWSYRLDQLLLAVGE